MQLYEQMDKNHDGRVTIDEFKKVFVEAIEVLQKKIENCLKYISDYRRSKEQAMMKLEEVKKTEKINAYGIMEKSKLTINVVEARELKPLDSGKTSDPFVKINFAGTEEKTKTIKETVNPVWNENFPM